MKECCRISQWGLFLFSKFETLIIYTHTSHKIPHAICETCQYHCTSALYFGQFLRIENIAQVIFFTFDGAPMKTLLIGSNDIRYGSFRPP